MYRSIAMGAVLALVSLQSAEAKITAFSNQAALMHVLNSKELTALLGTRALLGTGLNEVVITTSGPDVIGTEYKIDLVYGTDPRHPSVPTNCSVTATVVNEKSEAPHGITASHLSAPRFSKPDCAQ